MDDLIPSINKLHDVNNTCGVGVELPTLPEIIVLGEQSAGKSSVLESLVKQPILPRGEGLVTRCPIVLQLNYIPADMQDPIDGKARPDTDEWCTLLHKPGEIFTDFSSVTEEIIKQTNRIAGNGKNIVREAITVKVYSHRVLTLTVVDLPGIVKNPIGDQPQDIEEQVNSLLENYAKNEKSIILAVTPATQDMAASDSLKFAKRFDPEGHRTVVVITKLDMMAKGTDAKELLAGHMIQRRLGIFGVVNRNPLENQEGMSIEDKLESEERFLRQKYPTLAHQNGSRFLGLRLQEILKEHIISWIPDMMSQIEDAIDATKDELEGCGEAPNNKAKVMLPLLKEFVKTLDSAIDGKSRQIERKTTLGGEKIRQVFHQKLREMLDRIDPNDMTDEDILTCLQNSEGLESMTLNPDRTFRELVKDKILQLDEPAISCAKLASQEMRTVVNNCFKVMGEKFARFPNLIRAIKREVGLELDKYCEDALVMLKDYVYIQASFTHTTDPKFKDDMRSLAKTGPSTSGSSTPKSTEEGEEAPMEGYNNRSHTNNSSAKPYVFEKVPTRRVKRHSSSFENVLNGDLEDSPDELKKICITVRRLVASYFEIIKRAFEDFCPKTVVYFVVYKLQDNLDTMLMEKFYKDDGKMEELMLEKPTVRKKRDLATRRMDALLQAKEILSELRDTDFGV